MAHLWFSTSATAVWLFMSSPVHGQTAQDANQQSVQDDVSAQDIIVTANRREENVQKAAVAITAISGDTLIEQGITQLDDALKGIAGVQVSQGPTGLDPIIRGVGPSLPSNIGGDNGISTTYDGVYNEANISARAGYYDLARIEVVKGPQGTLYGRNAEGGAVNVISNNPTQQRGGDFSFETGNYGLVHATATINLPVTETLAVRAAGSIIRRDGYLSNGQDDNKALSGRLKILWKPRNGLSILLGAEYSEFSGHGPGTVTAFTTAPSHDIAYTSPNPGNQVAKQHGYKLWTQIDADMGFATLTVIPAYQWLSAPEQFQYTGLTNNIAPGIGSLRQKSLEARLASNAESAVEWVVGAYYYDNGNSQYGIMGTQLVAGQIVRVAPTNTSYGPYNRFAAANSKALFAQAKLPIGDKFRVVGGIRYSWDDKMQFRTNQQTVPAYASFEQLDWKAGMEFDLADRSMLYATVSTGYRPGGISPAPPNLAFGSERLLAYEVGSKNVLWDRRLRLNLSAYYYDYKDYQLSNLLLVPGQGSLLQIYNLPKVENYGAEIETNFTPTRFDKFSFSVAYLHSEIKSPFFIALPPPGSQVQGQRLPNSPKFSWNASYTHDFQLGIGRISPSLTVRHSDNYYVILPQTAISYQPGYTQYDATIAFAPLADGLSLSTYIKNITNETVKSNYVGNRLTLATPRTYGVVLSAKF